MLTSVSCTNLKDDRAWRARSNGCGTEEFGGHVTRLQNYFADKANYKNGALLNRHPSVETVTVTFREACDVHDAASRGEMIRDPFNNNRIVDFSTWSRKRVDHKFFKDLQKSCREQIPPKLQIARYTCLNGNSYLLRRKGAVWYHWMVRNFGRGGFDADPTTPDKKDPVGPRDSR